MLTIKEDHHHRRTPWHNLNMPSHSVWTKFAVCVAVATSIFTITPAAAFSRIVPCPLRRTIIASSALIVVSSTAESSASASNNTVGAHRKAHFQPYYQLVVNQDGTTSVVEREFNDVQEVAYSNTLQLLKKLDTQNFARPTDVVFTTLQGDNPWHYCPSPQIVVCTGGRGWYIRTSDGHTTKLPKGSILYQDNTEQHPLATGELLALGKSSDDAPHKGQHFSGSIDEQPCNQLIIQLELLHGVADRNTNPL
jgi:hypothetical protein